MDDAAAPEPAPIRPSGPRTERGKRRSRVNARVHGLTATLPDGDAEAALMQAFADRWAAELRPEVEAEEALIRSSAVAYARLERARKVEEATLRTCAQDAVDRWEKRKRHAVRRVAQDLAKDPYNTVGDLEASSFGCEWLMRHWLRLDAKLAQGIPWDHHDLARSMTLLGYLPQTPGPDGDPAAARFWHLARVVSKFSVDPMPGMPADPVPARAELRRLIGSELDRLESLRDELWEHQDGPVAESVAQAGLIDTSKEGQLRQRYRREAFSEMTRGINQVMRIRVERSKDDDRRWHQAHPELSRRRPSAGRPSASPAPSGAMPVPPPAPPPMADPAAGRPEPPRSADRRNEPSGPVAGAGDGRRNPNDGEDIRRTPSGDAAALDRRTEPRFPATPPRSAGPSNAASTPDGAPRRPESGDRRA